MDIDLSPKRLTLLVLRAQAGDRDAADSLLRVHQDELFGYLMKTLGDRSDAEDVLQTTLLQVVRKIRWLREPLRFRSWMFCIASRQVYRITKLQRQKHEFSNSDIFEEVSETELGDSQHQDLIMQIPKWLDRLTPNGREVIYLHYLEGFTSEEVADILGIPLGTVKSRISYSLACIRKQINHTKE
ncbi:ECF RNA polymerase sigma factor SigH [Rubripirellula tenax]|uniref:ECF RNA polymerase sigma factor SigH n=1 Tax=Rubripirellula tenax TaxID=2528015 RepID=A0A5C6FCV7_9BACT|nr:RNA polymerase sigma factor [Rubripirellula tenax]TWU58552.1 ECF RNA polymerase sigma factor SigH [Rubripirellula tenax]